MVAHQVAKGLALGRRLLLDMDQAGRDRIAANALLAMLGREIAGQGHQGALGTGIGGGREIPREGRVGQDVDDGPAAGPAHVRDRRLGRQHRPAQIDAHGLVPQRGVHGLDSAVTLGRQVGGRCVVVEDVQRAERLDGRLDHVADRSRIAEVQAEGHRLEALLTKGRGLGFSGVQPDVGDHHLGAFLAEQRGRGRPYAAAGAGDDRRLAFEPSRTLSHGLSSFLRTLSGLRRAGSTGPTADQIRDMASPGPQPNLIEANSGLGSNAGLRLAA